MGLTLWPSFLSAVRCSFHFRLYWKVITWKGFGYTGLQQRQHQMLKKHFKHSELFFFFLKKNCLLAPMANAWSWLILLCSLRICLRGEWVTFS